MSEASGGAWKCVNCTLIVSGLPPGRVFKFCPECGTEQSKAITETDRDGVKPPETLHDQDAPQECRNQDCKSNLFKEVATKECEKCSASMNTDMSPEDDQVKQKQQMSERQDSPQKEPKLEVCSNRECKFTLYSETTTVQCSGCNTANQARAACTEGGSSSNPQPPTSESMDVSPAPVKSDLHEVKNIPDKATNPSATPVALACSNPDCKEMLFAENAKMCHKCHTKQADPNETERDTVIKQESLISGNTQTPLLPDPNIPMPETTTNVSPSGKPDIKDSSVDLTPADSDMDTLQDSSGHENVPHAHPEKGLEEHIQTDKLALSDSGLKPPTLTRTSLNESRSSRKRPNGSNEYTSKHMKQSNDGEGTPTGGEGSPKDGEKNPTRQLYSAVAAKSGGASDQQLQVYKRPAYLHQDELLPSTKKVGSQTKDEVTTNRGYNLRSKDSSLSGLNPSNPEKTFTVTFRVLVPIEAWSWDSQATMCMRFGHPKLGQWKCDVGDFEHIGYVKEGLAEMHCTLKFDIDVFLSSEKSIPYKYIIFSPLRLQSEEASKIPYEYLHDCPSWFGSGIVNRMLDIPQHRCKPLGTYHQFDNMTFPNAKSKPVYTKFWESLKGLVRSSEKKTEVCIPNHDSMQKTCLEVYLEDYRKILCGCNLSLQLNVLEATNRILQIFNQLYCQKIENSYSFQRDWKSDSLVEVFRDWLQEIVKDLSSKESHSSEENGRRMASVLTVVGCLYDIIPKPLPWYKLDIEIVGHLLSMFALRPNIEGRQCFDLEVLLSLLPKSGMKSAADAVRSFCSHLSYHKDLRNPQWLYAIPLVHFLQKKSVPFGEHQLNPEAIDWNDLQFGLARVKSETSNKNLSLVEQHFHTLEPLAELDTLFLPIIVFVCPRPELVLLFHRIPPYLSATRVSVIVNQTKGMLNTNEIQEISKLIQAILKVTKDLSEKEAKRGYRTLEATLAASQLLLSRLTSKLPRADMLCTNAVKLVVGTLFYSASNLQLVCASDAESQKAAENCDTIFTKIITYLESWTNKSLSSTFGRPDHKKFTFAHEELKMWLSLIHLDCPQELLTKWHDMVQQMIKSRVAKVGLDMTIDLLCILESQEVSHTVITNVCVGAAMQSLERMDSQPTAVSVRKLYDALSKQRETVGRILEKILHKKYDPETEFISLEQLLEWDLWPTYITVYNSEVLISTNGGSDRPQSCLPECCTLVCAIADSTLTNVYGRLETGNVTLKELELIAQRRDQMEKLCSAHTIQNSAKKEAMKQILDLRTVQQKHFKETTELLGLLCRCVTVQVIGLDELKQQLVRNYDSTPISQLCPTDGSSLLAECCFKSAAPVCPIIVKFDTIARHLQSELFTKVWRNALKKASNSCSDLTIQHIVTEMWMPTITSCGALLDSIRDHSIKLSEVDSFFKGYMDTNDKIVVQLLKLYNGIEFYYNRPQAQACPKWITTSVHLMEQYWTLQTSADAAITVLDLKEKLKLTGDFSLIEILAHEMTTTMRDQTLAAVDESLIDAGEFLRELLEDKERLRCLKTFAGCMDIVNWIRDETKEVTHLHNFVSLALHTAAGEGDLANDSLSNLKKVGFGFGPLIYGLKLDTSFHSFRKQCRAVWETLKEQPLLPKLLRSCNGELDYYKNVKQTQASVEVTSFEQMNNIRSFGCYKIGSNSQEIFQNIDDVIHMTLTEKGKKRLVHTSYSLNELRDLESKLVLITGSNAENRAEVDCFLDTLHGVCRIADVLIALQQVGNVQYIGWVLEVPCRRKMVTDLQQQAKSMEHELEKWKEELKTMREQYYELNYYTTLQLLILRRELGLIKSQPSAVLKPNVVTLLRSISLQISSIEASQLVHSVISSVNQALPSAVPELSPKASLDVASNIESSHAPESVVACNKPSLSKEVLASADVQVSMDTRKHDLPKFSVESLTDDQAVIMTYCQDKLGFSRVLVLKAFEECGGDAPTYDVQNWCVENADKYQHLEQALMETDQNDPLSDDEEEEEVLSEYSSEPDTEMLLVCQPQRAVYEHHMESSVASNTPGIIQIEVAQKPLVDKYNPTVAELVSAGFVVEQSIDAVKRYETLDAAMEYLMSSGEEAGLFHSSGYETQPTDECAPVEQWDVSVPAIKCDSRTSETFLSLVELGTILTDLRQHLPQAILVQRPFNTRVLKVGLPNLLVTSPDGVLKTTLALYMEEEAFPLPTPEEVLVCNPSTTTEEVNLLWMRAINDGPEFRRIFCLVHAEKLSYQVCDNALRSLSEYSQGRSEYRLVIICSNEDEEKSHLISKLHNFRKQYVPQFDDDRYQQYLQSHFTGQVEAPYAQQTTSYSPAKASVVDHEISCVRVVASTRSGMGKSLRIKRMAEQLHLNLNQEREHLVTIPLHGPVVTPDRVLDFLEEHAEDPECTIYHLDIAPSVLREVDAILFSLLILSGLTDSKGRVWRCHPSQMYAVEVTLPDIQTHPGDRSVTEARTLALLNLLPTVMCVSPLESMELMTRNQGRPDLSLVMMDSTEFESPLYQRVYQYLRRYIGGYNLDTFSYAANVEGSPENCLEVITSKCGVRDPSWSEVRHFVEFFNIQLQSCEDSVFCDETFVGDVMSGLKGFVVKFMIRMSRDFATSSMKGEVARENMEEEAVDGGLEQYEIVERRLWEQNSHPYIFFNQDRISITFVGFKVTKTGDLVEPAHGDVLERGIMTQQLYAGLIQNRVNFEDDYRNWKKGVMIEKIATVMGIEFPHDPDETYVLTVDNLIKMLAIQMRFRCGIPVVIMGETGCGKTRLIRYMCDLARQGYDRNNMLILKVHGGTTEKDITDFVGSATKEALQNKPYNMDTVVFFDEANTTDAIGLIKEIMCDRRLNGKPVSKDLKFIAACNPYRKHTDDMIEKLEAAGLGFAVKTTETLEKLGKIPLRQLVYRVLDLPPSMRPLVYDFGQLNTGAEKDYVAQIVNEHVKTHPKLSQENPQIIPVIIGVLTWSQAYMRSRKDECSFVSLRDVERAMIVFEYFYEKMDVFAPLMNEWITKLYHQDHEQDNDLLEDDVAPHPIPNGIARALVLSVSVCYHARLRERKEYEEGVSRQFVQPLVLPRGSEQFRNEIRYCQEVLLDNMCLGENIARNAALRENVFMMAVCIELRIPLFLVGKPGSSKSLAKTIIHDSMRGRVSQKDLLKGFKEVTMLSYQCSQLSTPESVIEVFKTATQWQSKQDTKKFVAVVVLDEVGLAEDSPNLPLKALHPLLEDGTEGASKKVYVDEVVQREERVAFIGISNWALDPAKMNRGVMVTRGDPSEQELEFSAQGICSNEPNDPIKERLKEYFKPLAEAYTEICERQLKEKQFFGLRDFYSLIKMLYWMCERSQSSPTWPQLQHAIMRNFGGLQSDKINPLEIFKQKILINREPPDLTGVPKELHPIMNPDCSRLGLIRTSLSSREKTWHGENRYLLFLTENYAALDILKHYLSDVSLANQTTEHQDMEPFILFGSSFPKDKEYTQVCRNINQIKICMETGRTVILLNLENLYESLYDALNQYYIHSFGNRYVDLGLQTHRVKCRVHDNFKLILIAEKDTVYDKFPTPLINRLEKHFVLTSSVLEDWQKNVLTEFEEWIDRFSKTRVKSFKPGDAFIGFQKDTPAAVVFQATNHLKKVTESQFSFRQTMITESGILRPKELSDEDQESWSEAVLKLSQYLLLQTAAPDAVIRLEGTALADEKDKIRKLYFTVQHHSSIERFLNYHIHERDVQNGLLFQVTTHSHLLSHEEVQKVEDAISMEMSPFFLHEFDTELDFTNKLSTEFKTRQNDSNSRLVIIQCDSGHLNADLIACARYRIYDVRARPENEGITHVLFIIHLSHHQEKSLFVGFQGDPWISVHIDDLRPTSEYAITPQQAINSSISELFLGDRDPTEVVVPMEVVSESEPESELVAEEVMDQVSASRMENEKMQIDEGTSDDASEMSSIEVDQPEQQESRRVAKQVHSSCPLSLPPQYRRLHGCIQAAASKLQDTAKRRATKRVEILVNLIPKEPCLPLDKSSFLGILVLHIHEVLKERDQIWDQNEDWALKEAMDPKKLHNGGTFRNVLARKIDDVIIPIFAEIIACIDQNYNLDLIGLNNENSPLSQFWLSMFGNPEVMQFSYKDMTVARRQIPGVGGRRSEDVFQCKLPFSWSIKKTVDAQWDNVKSTAGNNFKKLHESLCEAIQHTPVGEVLELVNGTECEQFYHYYLHDFVKMVHSCHHKKLEKEDLNALEYKLIADAVNVMVHNPDISSIDGHESLTRRIAAVHVVYMLNRSQIMWFGQLTASEPGILLPLKSKEAPDSSEMVLHLYAVEKTLDVLAPPLVKDKTTEHLVPWLNRVRCSQNAISSIITLPSLSGSLVQIRLNWQLIRLIQLFVEHVLLKHDQLPVAYARRLELFLKSNSDFLKASTLDKVKKILNQIDADLKPKLRLKPETIRNIKKSCRQFFMEVVSSLCFGGVTAPEPDLITMLMEIVFNEKSESCIDENTELETRELTPYKVVSSDKIPTIRSFLLQLLLEHNDEYVKEHLNEYFVKSLRATGKQVDHDLCLLCVQCFEDSLNKKVSSLTNEDKTKRTVALLNEGRVTLRNCIQNSIAGNSLEYLEGIAQLRFALSIVAEALNQPHDIHTANLLHTARDMCTDPVINNIDDTGARDIVGPVFYLLKLLVRQFGLPCLRNAAEAYEWIIPKCLKTTDEEEKLIDCFVIYNECGYSSLRECVSGAAYGKQLESLVETTKDITIVEAAVLLLSFYQKVTLSRASTLPSKLILPDVLEGLDQSILGSQALNREMKWTARALIANQQGGPLAQLTVRPHQPVEYRILSAIVVHAVTVFSTMQGVEVLYPFVNMLINPANLLNAYLPTMQEDYLQEARRAMGGQFYECPRGHPYFVGECGRPVEERTCRTCGATIGGVNHRLRGDNVQARTNDTTKTGHDLGDPNGRTSVPAPERNLSAPAVCIIRALMHSAFIWASCNNNTAVGSITQLVKPRIPPDAVQEFFWRHLEKDIEHLMRVTGKAADESALIIHLVLKEILTKPPPTSTVSVVKTLAARNARQEWERVFNDHYVQPILENLEKSIGDAMHKILNDDNQDHDKLFYLVYEQVKVDKQNLEPHLWTFRSRITLEHLGQTLQDAKMKKKHPILHEFLQAEPNLRATQYLPDIVRLQQCLYDSFHHRLGRTDAMTLTVGQFLQGMKNENARNEYRERIESLQKAWSLVGQRLRTHARLRVDDKYFIPAITNETPLQYLIPTMTEAGVCTTALVDFLTLTHNDFIEKCRGIVIKNQPTKNQPSSAAFWREHKVPVTHIHGCHLLDYEQHLLSIVLSHCQYSLKLGKGCEIKYDHHALEKHILDRFIHGKPMILSDIPQVVYRKDIYTTVYFAAIRKKVHPQDHLTARMKQEILAELRTPDLLRETLDVVDIVLGFLSAGGGKAGRSLGEYIDKVLKMKKRRFSKKARDHCKLGHILSLWEMVSVQLAKLLCLRGEEPFDSVKENFLRELSGKESGDDQELALDKCLRTYDLDRLLGTLYEFIETYVKHSPENELDWPLVDTLEAFLLGSELPPIPQLTDTFPNTITLAQAVSTWKHIVTYQASDKLK